MRSRATRLRAFARVREILSNRDKHNLLAVRVIGAIPCIHTHTRRGILAYENKNVSVKFVTRAKKIHTKSIYIMYTYIYIYLSQIYYKRNPVLLPPHADLYSLSHRRKRISWSPTLTLPDACSNQTTFSVSKI